MSESIKINTDRLRSDAADIKKHIEGIDHFDKAGLQIVVPHRADAPNRWKR